MDHVLPLCQISCFYQKVDDWRNFQLDIMYFVFCKPTPLWFSVYRTSFPPCTKTPLAQRTFYIDTHLWYQRLLGTRGGGIMFYKIISFLVDYVVKKWHFSPKISKIRQYRSNFVWNQWRLIIQITNKYIFLYVEISALIGHISCAIITDLLIKGPVPFRRAKPWR